ncbi:MAG: 3-oxoacyl-ACP reductase FabG [Gammaproteobacteria bacterium]|nr:3-oxoacyl-ACP reductase FabG [Gammaproteobacteria bacterium]
MQDLNGQTAVVTGASRGIGKAIALELGQQGATVLGTATSDTGAESITAAFTEQAITGQGYTLDVSSPDSISRFADQLQADGHTPTILVNNAGITRDNLLMRMNDDEWLSVIDTNLNSVYRLSKLFIRGMMKARYGRIINITSVVGLSGNAGQSNYAAAKAGMIGFTKSLAREVGSRGITVNAVAPGFIETDMTSTLSEEQRQALLDQTALGRLGAVEEIAGAVAFLAGPHGGYITGETLNVNGGMYMA